MHNARIHQKKMNFIKLSRQLFAESKISTLLALLIWKEIWTPDAYKKDKTYEEIPKITYLTKCLRILRP